MKQYKPDFKDPRVRRRVEAVLLWCESMRLSNKPLSVHHDQLQRIFGNSRQAGLARWLRANLLRQVGYYKPGEKSFSYELKAQGYEKLHGLMDLPIPDSLAVAQRTYGDIARGLVSLEYREVGMRRYHRVQSVRRTLRPKLFCGWWDYDIDVAAPTLVSQYAEMRMRELLPEASTGYPAFPTIQRLIDDKNLVRTELAAATGLSMQTSKELLTALFFRASATSYPTNRIFILLGNDVARHARVMRTDFVKNFKREVRQIWIWALSRDKHENLQSILHGRHPSSSAFKSKASQRQLIYQALERQVVDAMTTPLLPQKSSRLVFMHDGFMSKTRLVVSALEAAALSAGYRVKISEKLLAAESDLDEESDVEELLGPS